MNPISRLIRPLLQNVTILILFLMPMSRCGPTRRRSGRALELLLTLAVTDFQNHPGQFLGALSLYAVMRAVTAIHSVLSLPGTRVEPLVSGYLGLSDGGFFIWSGTLISRPHEQPDRGRMVTFAVFSAPVIITWVGAFWGPTFEMLTALLSKSSNHWDDFGKGIIDTHSRHLLPELHCVRLVSDREVGRQRALARLALLVVADMLIAKSVNLC